MASSSLKKTRDSIEKQLQTLNTETIKLLAEDHSKAQEYIKIGRELTNAEELTDKQTEGMANEMMIIAKMILAERVKTAD